MSYRFDFWANFFGAVIVEIAVAYFVWSAIYRSEDVVQIGGFSFTQLMYYYTVVPIFTQILQAQSMHFMSEDIYQGGLTKFLIWPLNFVHYKLIAHLSFAVFTITQLMLALVCLYMLWGTPAGMPISIETVAAGIATALLGSVLYFLMAACLEMVAFWMDHVWSLNVMLRLSLRLLGGSLVPLSFFPAWSRDLVQLLPFWSMAGLPAELCLGRRSFAESWFYALQTLGWIAVFALLLALVWKRGRLRYTGVGI